MPNNPADRLSAWILEKAPEEPSMKRAQIYRDAAATIAGAEASLKFIKLAEETEAIEALYQQLVLEFRRDDGEARPHSAAEDV